MRATPFRRVIAPGILMVLLGTSSCSTSTPVRASKASTLRAYAISTAAAANIVKGLKAQSAPGEVLESIRAVRVVVGGRTVLEFYNRSSATTSLNVHSVTKSIMSTLIGIALAEGKLKSLEQTLGDLLPARAKEMKPSTAAITLRQLLTMTSGLPGDSASKNLDTTKSRDWVGDILRLGPAAAPGTFEYSSVGSHLLSAILVQATGESVLNYARAKLFDPLGIVTRPSLAFSGNLLNVDANGYAEYLRRYDQAGFTWPVDPQGNQVGFDLLKLRPADLAKFGQVYLDGGRWQGRQVIPADWVHDATTRKVASSGIADGYGYQWWVTSILGDPAPFAFGYGGQMVMLIPKRQMVLVVSSAADKKDSQSFGVDPQTLTYFVSTPIAAAVHVQK